MRDSLVASGFYACSRMAVKVSYSPISLIWRQPYAGRGFLSKASSYSVQFCYGKTAIPEVGYGVTVLSGVQRHKKAVSSLQGVAVQIKTAKL